MLRPTCAAVLLSAALLSGCSGQRTLNDDKLKSTATEVISIAAEAELFAAAAAQHHVPTKYIEGHPEYLRKQAQEIAKELAEGQAELSVIAQFDQLRSAVTQLIKTLDGLPCNLDRSRMAAVAIPAERYPVEGRGSQAKIVKKILGLHSAS